MKLFLAAAAMALTVASHADAATVTALEGGPAVIANPDASAVFGSVQQGVTGSIVNERASPWNDDVTPYTSVGAGGQATYNFGGLMSSISLVWGSPDTWNWIQFRNGSAVVDTLLGGSIAGYVQVAANGLFDRIVIGANQNAFEFAGLSATPAAVPVPAAGVLLVGAIAGLGALSRRRRTA